jgi:hypothetical protein
VWRGGPDKVNVNASLKVVVGESLTKGIEPTALGLVPKSAITVMVFAPDGTTETAHMQAAAANIGNARRLSIGKFSSWFQLESISQDPR